MAKRYAPTSCAIDVCPFKDAERSFHKIPKKPVRRQAWLSACKVTSFRTVIPKICSHHFKSEDFERNLRAELMGGQAKKVLKEQAVPSLFLTLDPEDDDDDETSSDLDIGCQSQQRLLPATAKPKEEPSHSLFLDSDISLPGHQDNETSDIEDSSDPLEIAVKVEPPDEPIEVKLKDNRSIQPKSDVSCVRLQKHRLRTKFTPTLFEIL